MATVAIYKLLLLHSFLLHSAAKGEEGGGEVEVPDLSIQKTSLNVAVQKPNKQFHGKLEDAHLKGI